MEDRVIRQLQQMQEIQDISQQELMQKLREVPMAQKEKIPEQVETKMFDFWQIDLKIKVNNGEKKYTGVIIANKQTPQWKVKERSKGEFKRMLQEKFPNILLVDILILRCVKINSDFYMSLNQEKS